MKRVFLASVGLTVALMGAAAAADLPRRAAPPAQAPAYVPAAYNWTGAYFGLNAGGGWGDSRWTDSATGETTGDFDVSGALIGAALGYNWQTGQVVFGVEGDLAWSNIDGSTTVNCATTCTTSNSWLATARGRLGFALDRVMPYVTAGVAFGDVEASGPGTPGESDTQAGWTAGGGLEFALAGNWTAKGEYLYVDLGELSCSVASCGGIGATDVAFNAHVVRGGLNLRF